MFNMAIPRLHEMREVIMGLFERLILPFGTKPANGWVKWRHSGIPDKEGEAREQARNKMELERHCKVCTVLSGDYFPTFNMPLYPQHPHCDCMLFSISKPTLQAVATCDVRKFSDYLFGEKYANNGKVKLFKLLGFTVNDTEYLLTEFEKQAKQKYLSGDYILGKHDQYGQHITIAITGLKSSLKGGIIIKTGWMVRPLGLITCNTPLGG